MATRKASVGRRLSAAIATLLVIGLVAGPTTAAPTPPSSATTMAVSGCDFTVTYTWSGFKGRRLIASFGLYERSGSLDISFDLVNVEGQLGRAGSLTHTFSLSPGATAGRIIVARGALYNSRTFQQIDGSSSASSAVYSTCG
jgi:hypothetical protein